MPFELCLCVLIFTLFLIIFQLLASLDISDTWYVNRPATKTSTRDTYSASSGSKNFILAKNWSHDPLFMVTSFLSILSTSSEFSTSHAFHLFKLIFSVVTSFVLLSEEKISKNKMIIKVEQYLKWTQDPLFVVIRFLSILSMSSEFSIGHIFHLFKLIFSMVNCFVLLSEEKISKNKKKRSKNSRKQRQPKNREKREGQK